MASIPIPIHSWPIVGRVLMSSGLIIFSQTKVTIHTPPHLKCIRLVSVLCINIGARIGLTFLKSLWGGAHDLFGTITNALCFKSLLCY